MALFGWHKFQEQQKPVRPSRPVHQHAPALPEFMNQLHTVCRDHRHPYDVTMRFIGYGRSDRGQPMTIYACPVCGAREGWVVDFKSGAPLRLWRRT